MKNTSGSEKCQAGLGQTGRQVPGTSRTPLRLVAPRRHPAPSPSPGLPLPDSEKLHSGDNWPSGSGCAHASRGLKSPARPPLTPAPACPECSRCDTISPSWPDSPFAMVNSSTSVFVSCVILSNYVTSLWSNVLIRKIVIGPTSQEWSQ